MRSRSGKKKVFPTRFGDSLFQGNLSSCEFYRFTKFNIPYLLQSSNTAQCSEGLTYFTPFSSVSIAKFEQANAG